MIFENINKNMDAMLGALQTPVKEVEGLSGAESFLANKEAEQDSKGIDWAEFDKLDQIIFSSND